jgi:hypothetical protein
LSSWGIGRFRHDKDKPIFYNVDHSIRSAFASYEARGVKLSQQRVALVQTLSELGESHMRDM